MPVVLYHSAIHGLGLNYRIVSVVGVYFSSERSLSIVAHRADRVEKRFVMTEDKLKSE